MNQEHYVDTNKQLEIELDLRLGRQNAISESVDALAKRQYGITSFSRIVESFAPKSPRPAGVLARQIPCLNIEGFSIACLCQLLDLDLIISSYEDDTFTEGNREKVLAINPRVRKVGPKRTTRRIPVFVEDQEPSALVGISGEIPSRSLIRDIKVPDAENINGVGLVRSRTERFCEATGSLSWDVSSFWRACVDAAEKKPEVVCFAFQNRHGAHLPRLSTEVDYRQAVEMEREGKGTVMRPTAKWYYPLYLCLFMTGTRVLMEAYSDLEGRKSDIDPLFKRASDLVCVATGYRPMVVRTHSTTLSNRRSMLDCNAHVTPVAMVDVLRLHASIKRSVSISNLQFEIARSLYDHSPWRHDLYRALGDLNMRGVKI